MSKPYAWRVLACLPILKGSACTNFEPAADFLQAMPREELHQILIGVYGNYIIPSTLYEVEQVLRRPDLIFSKPGADKVRYLVSNEMLGGVWAWLQDRLCALNSSSSMVEVTVDYAAHFMICI